MNRVHRARYAVFRPFGVVMMGLTLAGIACAKDNGEWGIAERVQIAGKELKLSGVGISYRMIFKVYAMGLYLPDARSSASKLVEVSEPRRLCMSMLRDVSSDDFNEAITDYMMQNQRELGPKITAQLQQLSQAIGRRSEGLRKGDLLTLDWVPDTGVVVELNRKQLTEPLRDVQFYNLLLGIWLGDKPADPLLKSKLLGLPENRRASVI